MITQDDYKNAAYQCQAVNKPNETAYLLYAAATYMLDRERQQNDKQAEKDGLKKLLTDAANAYSYAAAPESDVIKYTSATEFGQAVNGLKVADVMPIFDELMTAVSVYKKNLYHAALNRLYELK